MPELPTEPKPEPGPNGQAYTLAALQQIAAENSPTLRQAAFDVQQARGNLIQAGAYPNPTISQQVQPSNDGSTAGVWGIGIDQTIKTFGKLTLATAAAQKALDNAELALKRSRSDLSTQVRNNYFALLVSKETVRVNKALAEFTDEVYRLQEKLLEVGSRPLLRAGRVSARPGLLRPPRLQAVDPDLHLQLEAAGSRHRPAPVAAERGRRPHRRVHSLLRVRSRPGPHPPEAHGRTHGQEWNRRRAL